MISLSLAKRLKEAGLVWQAGVNDYFAIPDRDMDDRIFVLSDLLANLNLLRGWPVVTFHGTAEWALDYILTTEVVWLPREDQLRQLILESAAGEKVKSMQLDFDGDYYQCKVMLADEELQAQSASATDAYGQILLELLMYSAPAEDGS
jgi:hypothetical protein